MESLKSNNNHTLKKFTQGYTFKILMLIALSLLLLIPLSMISGLIYERNRTANSAEAEVMEAWGSQLMEAGPVIMVPGVRTEQIRTKVEREGGRTEEKIEELKYPFTLIIMPQKLNIRADFTTEIRRRGIFSVPLFSGDLALSGTFDPAGARASLSPNEQLSFSKAELVIALSSQKGIRKIKKALWDNQDLFFQPGNRGLNIIRKGAGGIYAAIPDFTGAESAFDINIAIQGGQLVRLVPLGQDTHVEIATDWASPSFQGSFLPGGSTITDSGFDAVWDISYLSRDIPLFWKTETGDYRDYTDSMFGVNFFRAIDTYSLNTRAVKYAILFVIIPFLTLFLLEVFTKKRIHPVPYLLAGIANVIFYLLLLSFSEQMQFYLAYLLAALSVTAMMTLYSRSLLPSCNKSWYMGLVTTISYVLLYAVLNAESYALLIGSVGAFLVVGLVMFITRKLEWYAPGE
jgi:inner membrane protein